MFIVTEYAALKISHTFLEKKRKKNNSKNTSKYDKELEQLQTITWWCWDTRPRGYEIEHDISIAHKKTKLL